MVFMRISPYKTTHLWMVPRKTRFQEFWTLTIKSTQIKYIRKKMMMNKYKSLRRQQEQSLRMKHIKSTPLKLYPKPLLSSQLPTAHLNGLWLLWASCPEDNMHMCEWTLYYKQTLLLVNRLTILWILMFYHGFSSLSSHFTKWQLSLDRKFIYTIVMV